MQPLTNDRLALNVFQGIRSLPALESSLFAPTTSIPEDSDAVLYVSFEGLAIDVQGKDAVITTVAKATMTRESDGKDIYTTIVYYTDRDKDRQAGKERCMARHQPHADADAGMASRIAG